MNPPLPALAQCINGSNSDGGRTRLRAPGAERPATALIVVGGDVLRFEFREYLQGKPFKLLFGQPDRVADLDLEDRALWDVLDGAQRGQDAAMVNERVCQELKLIGCVRGFALYGAAAVDVALARDPMSRGKGTLSRNNPPGANQPMT